MNDSGAPTGTDSTRVKVEGEDAVLHITDQSVMFEKGGTVSGFERSAIRMPRPYAEPQRSRLSETLPDHPERMPLLDQQAVSLNQRMRTTPR